jgi:hypothetical protein
VSQLRDLVGGDNFTEPGSSGTQVVVPRKPKYATIPAGKGKTRNMIPMPGDTPDRPDVESSFRNF